MMLLIFTSLMIQASYKQNYYPQQPSYGYPLPPQVGNRPSKKHRKRNNRYGQYQQQQNPQAGNRQQYGNNRYNTYSPAPSQNWNNSSSQNTNNWRNQEPANIQLIGFENRNEDQDLINAFAEFVTSPDIQKNIASPNSANQLMDKLDIKIDRHQGFRTRSGQNNYTYSLVKHDFGVFGSAASNHSRSVGNKVTLSRNLQLPSQLDKEQWISKIVLHFEPNQNLWTIQKFGGIHSIYRGATRFGKAAVVASIL